MKKILFVMVLIGSVFVMGCKRAPKPAEKAVVNNCENCSVLECPSNECAAMIEGEWEIRGLELNGIAQTIFISGVSFKAVEDGIFDFNGNAGINKFFGTASMSKKEFKVADNVASTKMSGAPEAMEFEDAFLSAFCGADSFELFKEGEMTYLKLSSSDGSSVITFQKK